MSEEIKQVLLQAFKTNWLTHKLREVILFGLVTDLVTKLESAGYVIVRKENN